MKNKKSGVPFYLILFLLAAFFFLVMALLFPSMIGKSVGEVNDLLSSTKDYDNDGIANFFDKCPCDVGEEDFDGCGTEAEIKNPSTSVEDCKKKMEEE